MPAPAAAPLQLPRNASSRPLRAAAGARRRCTDAALRPRLERPSAVPAAGKAAPLNAGTVSGGNSTSSTGGIVRPTALSSSTEAPRHRAPSSISASERRSVHAGAASTDVRIEGSSTNGASADVSSNGASNGSHAPPTGMAALAAIVRAAVKTHRAGTNGNGNGNGSSASSLQHDAAHSLLHTSLSASTPDDHALQQQLNEMKEALEDAQRERLQAEARAQQAEIRAQQAQDALLQAQDLSTKLNRQYSEVSLGLEAERSTTSSSSSSFLNGLGAISASSSGTATEVSVADKQLVEDLQAQLEDLDYRLGWALRDLRAHQLVLRAQGELSLHLSGLPSSLQQHMFDQVDSGAELLGDGGSATVHAITLQGQQLAVKVMPLYDINTARPYHFRDICTTFLRHERSPYLELPLHTCLRLKDDEVEGTQYFLYTVWPRRHMDVDQLLCSRPLQDEEVMTIMLHSVLALQDLAVARMVHADVKPPNVLVMLGADGLVTSAHLTDFGSVQFVPPGEQASPAIWDGQLAWNWPPEQRDWVHLEACDAWGLALLYSCMRVQNPTKPEVTDVLQDMFSKNTAEFERVRDTELLPDSVSDPPEIRSLTRLMRKCVVKDPKKRPGIRELVGAIQVLREQMQMQKRAVARR